MAANINDTSAIQALLDQLKSSEAWQKVASTQADAAGAAISESNAAGRTVHDDLAESISASGSLVAPPILHLEPVPLHGNADAAAISAAGSSSASAHSVASLLSQLQSSSSFNAVAGPSITPAPPTAQSEYVPPPPGGSIFTGPRDTPSNDTPPRAPHTPPESLRACSFQQALPHLARLSEDAVFLRTLTAMKSEQADLERQLWKERREIQKRHEERVKTARTKASIIGAGLTQYEADAMTDSFRTELLKFDRERVLPAWDGLVTKQQIALEALGVPAMFPSMQTSDRERQQKVMQVLGGIVGNEGSGKEYRPLAGP